MKLTKGGGGNWIKPDQVVKGQLITIKDSGRVEDSDKYKYDDGNPVKNFLFTVHTNKEDKTLRFTKASRDNCVEAWGDETEAWVGKQAALNLIPSSNGKKSILVEPIADEWKM